MCIAVTHFRFHLRFLIHPASSIVNLRRPTNVWRTRAVDMSMLPTLEGSTPLYGFCHYAISGWWVHSDRRWGGVIMCVWR